MCTITGEGRVKFVKYVLYSLVMTILLSPSAWSADAGTCYFATSPWKDGAKPAGGFLNAVSCKDILTKGLYARCYYRRPMKDIRIVYNNQKFEADDVRCATLLQAGGDEEKGSCFHYNSWWPKAPQKSSGEALVVGKNNTRKWAKPDREIAKLWCKNKAKIGKGAQTATLKHWVKMQRNSAQTGKVIKERDEKTGKWKTRPEYTTVEIVPAKGEITLRR
jgi:hypothetical protein